MILAAGLSPAWQHVIVLPELRPGDVNRARAVYGCASGKVVNAALAMHHAAAAASAALVLTTAGGATGALLAADLDRLGLAHRLIPAAAATRECTTLLDQSTGTATELVENVGPIAVAELAEFRAAYGEEVRRAGAVALTGSTPPGAPADLYRELVAAAPCPVVVDASGPLLLEALAARPRLAKPNRAELAATLGRPIASDAELHDAMRELVRRGAQAVAVTHGARPTWVLDRDKLEQLAPPPASRVVNPIGCGDCLAGGAAWSLGRGATLVEAVAQGLELAAQNLATLLPARFADP